MKNVPFVIWMLIYPILNRLCDILEKWSPNYSPREFSDTVLSLSALFSLAFWIIVGVLLYERKESDTVKHNSEALEPVRNDS
jgi:fucose 4-O-acetylase-like acetyltransferase